MKKLKLTASELQVQMIADPMWTKIHKRPIVTGAELIFKFWKFKFYFHIERERIVKLKRQLDIVLARMQ